VAVLIKHPRIEGQRAKEAGAFLMYVLSWALPCFSIFAAELQSAISREYQVKAVFLYNFAQFVEWPADAFARTNSPLVIGVLGDDPFGAYLDETVRNEQVGERRMAVERYRRWEEIKSCHILFISRSESSRLEAVLNGTRNRNILTVGDFDGFAQRGGMIRFMTENGKIRLRVSLDTIKASNLKMSSKLLRPAQIIGSGKD